MSEPKKYWHTRVSKPTTQTVEIRGFTLDDLIAESTFTQTVFLLIRGELPTPSQARVLDAALNGVLDYGLEKPGTVAARFIISANPSMAAGLAAACLAVGENTLATEFAGRFIRECHREFSEQNVSVEEYARRKVEELRSQKKRIPGLGHPLFKKVDPRAQQLRTIADSEGLWGESARLYEAVHQAFIELPGKADIPINDVGALAAVLDSLGFTPEEGTGLAIMSTFPGLIAHVSEELNARVPIRKIPVDDVIYEVPPLASLPRELSAKGWGMGTRSVAHP